MNGSRFDVWTRRRVGLALGGGAASLLARLAPEGAGAKKRCRKLGVPCARTKQCCHNRRCAPTGEIEVAQSKHCCKTEGSCRSSKDCCRPFGCNLATSRCEVP